MHELRYYLESLLDHECSTGECAECQRLLSIYEFMRTGMFASVIFTDTPLESRKLVKRQPTVTRAAAPRRPPAG